MNGKDVLVLGVGNTMKGDDGVGPYVVQRLLAAGADRPACEASQSISAIDCGTVPENFTSSIRRLRPRLLVIVDAADMGLEVGEYRAIAGARVGSLGLSTHSMPLSLFMTYVSDLVGSILLIGVQPRTMALGDRLSAEVSAAGDTLVGLLTQGRAGDIKPLG